MITRPLAKADYDYIVSVMDDWWGGPTSALAHPIFFYELGQLARVTEDGGRVVGFLLGFIAEEVGYVHLVGIDPVYRRKQVGSRLYRAFEEACMGAGCSSLKAIATVGNELSVRFHVARGWSVEQVTDYAGPGRHRVVFSKALAR